MNSTADPLQPRRVEVAEAGVVRREAAQRQRRAHVHEGVRPAHAAPAVGEEARQRQREVQQVQRLGGVGDARRQLGFLERSRRLRLEHLRAADAEHRQDRHRQHQDAHAADPLQEVAPDVDRQRQVVEPDEHRRAGGRHCRDAFEVRAGERQCGQVQHQRQGGERRQAGPYQRHQQEAVARQQLAHVAPGRAEQHGTRPQRERDRHAESSEPGIAAEQRERQRHQHHDREDHDDGAKHVQDRGSRTRERRQDVSRAGNGGRSHAGRHAGGRRLRAPDIDARTAARNPL
jgi:hypothetical protein